MFNGGANQSLTGSGATTFRGLTINPSNSAVVVTLSIPFTMSSGNASLTVSAGTLDLGTSALTISSSPPLTVSSGATLRYGGATFPSSGTFGTTNFNGTVEYNGTTVTQTVLNHSYTNLTLSGSTTKTLPSASLSITGAFTMAGTASTTAAGALTVGGAFTLGAGTSFDGATFTHNVAGNFANNGATFTPSTSTFNFTGSAAQVIGGSSPTTFNILNVSNNSGTGPSLGNTITVSGSTLNLGAKIITTGANTLALTAASPTVTRSTGFVNGNLQKAVAGSGSPSVTFEVGTTSPTVYAPVTVNFASTSTPGTLTVSSTAGLQPQFASSGLSQTKYVNRYWTAVNNGITFTTYDATLNFVAGDLVGSPDTSSLQVRKYNGTWVAPASSASTATSATGAGFTSFSDFAVGVLSYPIASSTATSYPGNVPQNAVDGNPSTWWQPVAGSVTPTLTIDRGPSPAAITSLETQWVTAGYQGIDFTIQTSTDSAFSSPTTVATVSGNTSTDLTTAFSSTSDRYLRIVVTNFNADNGDPWAHLALVEAIMGNSVTYPLASSTATSYPGNVPQNAVDGNPSTWWQPVAGSVTPTLTIDRGPSPAAITSLETQWVTAGYQGIDFTIQTSTDSAFSSPTTVATVSGNTSTDLTTAFSSTSDRYLRIVVTNFNADNGDPWAHLALVEAIMGNSVTYPLASSTATSYPGNVPQNAVDGNPSTWWQPVAGSVTPTLTIDRGPSPAAITSLETQWVTAGYQGIDFTIQTSTDSAFSSPTTVATVSGNTSTDLTTAFSSTSDRYLRIVVTNFNADNGDPWAHLALVEAIMGNSVTYPLASSPDTPFGGSVPANTIDGNLSTWWQPVAATVTPTLTVDRGPSAGGFSSVRTQWYSAVPGYQGIDYTIQTSTDSAFSSPTTVATVTGNTQTDRAETFTSTSDRYLRIVITGFNPAGGDPYAHLALAEFSWGSAASSPDASFGGSVPQNAFDGNLSTWWQPAATAVTPTWAIDRGSSAGSFSSVRTQWYSAVPGYQGIDYTIQTSTDAAFTSPTIVATVTGNTQTDRTETFATTSDRYVRIVVTGVNPAGGDPYAHLALLEFSWSSVVTYPLASSQDTSFGGSVPANAIDGNLSTWWQPVAATATPTLVIDRGPSASSFSSVRTQWYSAVPGYQGIDYTIQTSTDAAFTSPTTVATVTGNALTDRTETFTSTSDRYVRIVVTNFNPDLGDPWAHLALVELTLS